jgi:SAM-dependent methyltransferase
MTQSEQDRFTSDTPDYVVRPITAQDIADEQVRAREFWRLSPTNLYYRQFAPQTLLLIHLLRGIGAQSVLEVGCNVGRNLNWIRRYVPGIHVAGLDVNPDAIVAGREYFGFSEQELWVADDRSLGRLADRSYDAIFTVSVLDHLPEIEETLRHMLRIARQRLFLIELVLPSFGRIDDPRCIDCSYSHDYLSILRGLACKQVRAEPTPLAEGILEHYQLFEVEPAT